MLVANPSNREALIKVNQCCPERILQKGECKRFFQQAPLNKVEEVKDCISYDTIQVLRSMSQDDSSLKSIKRHLLDWTSLDYVCPPCAKFLRNQQFYFRIAEDIQITEKYFGTITYQFFQPIVKSTIYHAFISKQPPEDCERLKNLRIKQNWRSEENSSSEIVQISEETNSQSSPSEQNFSQCKSNCCEMKEISIIDLQMEQAN